MKAYLYFSIHMNSKKRYNFSFEFTLSKNGSQCIVYVQRFIHQRSIVFVIVKPILVPVGYDYQVQHVAGVLSMENVSPHMYEVRTIENEMIPQEILERNVVLVTFRPR